MRERERMRQEETPKERAARLKRAYGWLYDEALAILFEHDPIGINFETNTDEYAPEAATILPRLAYANSATDLGEIVCEEFEYWFGLALPRLIGPITRRLLKRCGQRMRHGYRNDSPVAMPHTLLCEELRLMKVSITFSRSPPRWPTSCPCSALPASAPPRAPPLRTGCPARAIQWARHSDAPAPS